MTMNKNIKANNKSLTLKRDFNGIYIISLNLKILVSYIENFTFYRHDPSTFEFILKFG